MTGKNSRQYWAIILSLVLILTLSLPAPVNAAEGDTTRVSVATSGGQASDRSDNPSISADGRYVAFESAANDLVAGDTAIDRSDVFVHDRQTGVTVLVSVKSDGTQDPFGVSGDPFISASGRYVAFETTGDLDGGVIPLDANGGYDVYIHDRDTDADNIFDESGAIRTTLISADSSGIGGAAGGTDPAISADGRYVAFYSESVLNTFDTNGLGDIYRRDWQAGTTMPVSVDQFGFFSTTAISTKPTISNDGRYVAFSSAAPEIVAGDTDNWEDVFVRDMTAGVTVRVSVTSGGGDVTDSDVSYPFISSNGRYVTYAYGGNSLVTPDSYSYSEIYIHDRDADGNGTFDETGIGKRSTTRLSMNFLGAEANASSYYSAISSDGSYVIFDSQASDIVPRDTNGVSDYFVWQKSTGRIVRVSLDSDGIQGNGNSPSPFATYTPAISSDGRFVAFQSGATNLVSSDDTNGVQDIFVHEPDFTSPTVLLMGSSTIPADDTYLTVGPTQLTIQFSESVLHDGSAYAADSISNYLLVEDGLDSTFQTTGCPTSAGDDDTITINSASYSDGGGAGPFVATLNINDGGSLQTGSYRLFICGTTSIYDMPGNRLNGGSDSTLTFFVGLTRPSTGTALPATGFAPGQLTLLPEQPAELKYATSDLWLEIPRLKVQIPIVGVPSSKESWDVSWLGSSAGWLEGTAFPTWAGNSVLTAHVYDAFGQVGPFVHLNWLWWGDRVIVHAWGQEYIYEVRAVTQVKPEDMTSVIKHEELPWLTLLTCRSYDEVSDTYRYRVIVRAVQVKIR